MRMHTIEQSQKALEGLDGLDVADMRAVLSEAGTEDAGLAPYTRTEISEGVPASVVTVQTARAMLRHWQAQSASGEALTSTDVQWRNAHVAGVQCAQEAQDAGTPIAVRIAAEQGQGTASQRARAQLALYAVVENAMRAQATEIAISIERSGDGTVVTVKDNGTGVRDLRLLGRRRRSGWSDFEHWGIEGQGMRWLEQWTLHIETRCTGGIAHRVIIPPGRAGEEQVVVSQPLKDGGKVGVRGTRIQWVDKRIDAHGGVGGCWRDAAQRVGWGWEGRRVTVNDEEPEGGAERFQCERNVWANNAVAGMVGVSKRCTPGQPDVALAGIDAHVGLGSANTPQGTVYARAQLSTRYRGLKLDAVRDTIMLTEEGQVLKDTAALALERWKNEHQVNTATWRVPGPTPICAWVRTAKLEEGDIALPVLGSCERWALAAARAGAQGGPRYAVADTMAGYATARSNAAVHVASGMTCRPTPVGGGIGAIEGTDTSTMTIELPMVIDPLYMKHPRVHLEHHSQVDVRLIAEAIEECWNETQRGAWMETVKAIREGEGIKGESVAEIGRMAGTLSLAVRSIEGTDTAQARVTMHLGVVHLDGVAIEETAVGARQPISGKVWRRAAEIMREWFEIDARHESTKHTDEIVTTGTEAEVGAALGIAATSAQGTEGKITTWLPTTSTGEPDGTTRYGRTRAQRMERPAHGN